MFQRARCLKLYCISVRKNIYFLSDRINGVISLVRDSTIWSLAVLTIEIINNTRAGIEVKIWERANWGGGGGGANLDHRCTSRNRSVALETTKY